MKCMIFFFFTSNNLHLIIGEVSFANNINVEREAHDILQFRPDRLGHALFLPTSVYNNLYENPIPIECCPTSNTMTLELNLTNKSNKHQNMIDGLKQHPQLSTWIEREYPFSLSTDDPGVFHTNSSVEFYRFMLAFNVDPSFVANVVVHSIQHIFEPNGGKDNIIDNKKLCVSNGEKTKCVNVKKFLETNVAVRVADLVEWMDGN